MLYKIKLNSKEDFKSFKAWGEIVDDIEMRGKPIFESDIDPREYPATLIFTKSGKKINYDFIYLSDLINDVKKEVKKKVKKYVGSSEVGNDMDFF